VAVSAVLDWVLEVGGVVLSPLVAMVIGMARLWFDCTVSMELRDGATIRWQQLRQFGMSLVGCGAICRFCGFCSGIGILQCCAMGRRICTGDGLYLYWVGGLVKMEGENVTS
jgi:hypothetical protein